MPNQRDMAIELMQQQHYSQALPIFSRLIKDNPEDWYLYYMAGQCYRCTNDIPGAVRLLTKAASFNPDVPQVYLALGIALQLAEDYELAIEKLKQAIVSSLGMVKSLHIRSSAT